MTLSTAPPMRVVLIGAGKVGTTVAHILHESGHVVVGVASRTRRSAERATAARFGAGVFDVRDGLPPCEVALIATNDDAIAEVAEEAGTADAALTGPIVRGDTGTISRHVSELWKRAPDLAESYVRAMRDVLAAALRAGSLEAAQGRDVERALEAGWI